MRLYVRVKGNVQGVGYRIFAIQTARLLQLTGWVRNLVDGDVEAEVQGEEKNLKKFLIALEKGPLGARVDSLKSQGIAERLGEETFKVQ